MHAGADVDVADPEGYTPLHMAAGYLHVDVINTLLAAGADVTRPDRQGRSVVGLVESLRERMSSASLMQQRLRLESVRPPSCPHSRAGRSAATAAQQSTRRTPRAERHGAVPSRRPCSVGSCFPVSGRAGDRDVAPAGRPELPFKPSTSWARPPFPSFPC